MEKITEKMLDNLELDVTSDARLLIEEAVIEYIMEIASKSVELANMIKRKTLKKEDVEVVIKYF